MHVEIKGVHLDIKDELKEHIDKKMHRLDFAEDMIVDLLFTLTREKNSVKTEVTVNFRWGNQAHIGTNGFDIVEAVDSLFDKLVAKVTKEKEKIQQH